MRFYNTNKKSASVSLKEAALKGLASDGGLFMPQRIPRLPDKFFKTIQALSFQDISFAVAKNFLGADISDNDLRKIVDSAINFDAPLKKLSGNIFALELFHGPTAAFKDFGARFAGRLLAYLRGDSKDKLIILVATSGDTGSAVASGFFNVPCTQVVILYPSGRVSNLQEKLLTTMGGNVLALEIKGTFDDCQGLAKQAFVDAELNNHLRLTSANSINIARLLAQLFYYFYGWAQLKNQNDNVVISVPSGNFGNLTAGLMAKRMGLPVAKFIAATNINDVFGEYLKTGKFRPRLSRPTISNAMDVGNPSNFARMLELYDHDVNKIRADVFHARFTDAQTKKAISQVFQKYRYLMDPHTAIGYLGLTHYQKIHHNCNGIFLATAHPAKFSEIIEETLKQKIEIPKRLKKYQRRKKQSVVLPNEFKALKNFLLNL